MSRAAAAGVAALLAILALEVGGPEPGAAAGECVWTKHSKRVVKKVKKRNGKLRRVRRTKHWWSCDPTAAPPPLAPVPPAVEPPPPPPEEPEPAVGRLGVRAEEWSFTLSRPEIAAGDVIVELNNQGEDPHDLNLLREGDEGPPLVVAEALPSQQTSARFDLPPGSYRLWCDIGEHDEYGMNATLLVAP